VNHMTSVRRVGRHVVFRCGEQSYALPIERVEEILPLAEVAHVPNAPSFLNGFLDIGGEPVAVISLSGLLGIERREPELYTPLILLKSASPRIAMEVDEVLQIVELDEQDLRPIIEDCSFNDCAASSVRVDDKTLLVLSPQKLLLEEEQKRIAELTAMELRRLEALNTLGAC
jgi:purine-binding chemotaxis protein CheW